MWSRIRTSSSRYAGNSFVPVHQLDFQSWMTPMRIPPGCTFWPITGHLSSGSCAPAAKRPGGREAGGRGPASNCGLLALRALRGRSAGPAVARRRRGTLSFRPVAQRVRNGWRKDHGDVASALLDACDAAARTRAPALDRRALVGIGRGHVEVVADQPVIGLGVCDRRAEDAVELARRDARREREHRPRLRNAPAADGVGNDARLPRGHPHPLRFRANLVRPVERCLHFFCTCLSPAWPRNVRVGANSPSLWPTICSEMKTGTSFRPSWMAIVWPTISGKTVDERDHVRIIRFSFTAFIDSIRLISRSSTYGPFLLLLLMAS